MTSPSSKTKPRRTRIAWLIGVIVLMGVGMVVWGNWDSLRIRYYVYQIESGAKSITGIYYVEGGGAFYPIPPELKYDSIARSMEESIKALTSMGEEATASLEKLLESPNRKVRLWTAHMLTAPKNGCPAHLKPKAQAIRKDPENWKEQ